MVRFEAQCEQQESQKTNRERQASLTQGPEGTEREAKQQSGGEGGQVTNKGLIMNKGVMPLPWQRENRHHGMVFHPPYSCQQPYDAGESKVEPWRRHRCLLQGRGLSANPTEVGLLESGSKTAHLILMCGV